MDEVWLVRARDGRGEYDGRWVVVFGHFCCGVVRRSATKPTQWEYESVDGQTRGGFRTRELAVIDLVTCPGITRVRVPVGRPWSHIRRLVVGLVSGGSPDGGVS